MLDGVLFFVKIIIKMLFGWEFNLWFYKYKMFENFLCGEFNDFF